MKKTGKCIGGPLDGHTITAEAEWVEAAHRNEAYDPLRHGTDLSEGFPSTRDGAGNRMFRLVRYYWQDGAWHLLEP